jgi:hypothetical protein
LLQPGHARGEPRHVVAQPVDLVDEGIHLRAIRQHLCFVAQVFAGIQPQAGQAAAHPPAHSAQAGADGVGQRVAHGAAQEGFEIRPGEGEQLLETLRDLDRSVQAHARRQAAGGHAGGEPGKTRRRAGEPRIGGLFGRHQHLKAGRMRAQMERATQFVQVQRQDAALQPVQQARCRRAVPQIAVQRLFQKGQRQGVVARHDQTLNPR